MKQITAIVQPLAANRVVESLRRLQSPPGITVSFVSGFGRSSPQESTSEQVNEEPMSKIEIVVPDDQAETVVEVIIDEAHTGESADGKIFIHKVLGAIRISTGERGNSAIV
jgi:nitrogen regulatory protein P-II 1